MPEPIVWLVLLLPIAAASGWWARARAERDLDKHNRISRTVSRDYASGITHLVNDDADRAIETFSRLLAIDDDTIETHLALGNLFRRQGEIDRALRLHQNLIARPQLSLGQRNQARFELACDYLRAGVLDRAERLFDELAGEQAHAGASLTRLLGIHEQTREWNAAIDIARRIARLDEVSMDRVVAQYHCERAGDAFDAGDVTGAFAALREAERVSPSCARANLMRGRYQLSVEAYDEAIRAFRRVIVQDSRLIMEIVEPVISACRGLGDIDGLLRFFDQMLARTDAAPAHIGRAKSLYEAGRLDEAIAHLSRYLQGQANWLAFHTLLEYSAAHGRTRLNGPLDSLRQALGQIIRQAPTHACDGCGFSSRYLHWQCPSCRRWDTIRPLADIAPATTRSG
ncbi:lipopolysaccharide assembly protein LapB [uncultured Salinisphaera sp.]|uniref:lipopolysaccharide assembly protein LapB n=1 Tax=uncultured Salinisphaera sp. TaxID=359372 RepID=UPI0032B1A0E2|tara:strand:+ start:6854 stop:8050 length:1197 start_codon:yes stop_codon:yes gene_type:complete